MLDRLGNHRVTPLAKRVGDRGHHRAALPGLDAVIEKWFTRCGDGLGLHEVNQPVELVDGGRTVTPPSLDQVVRDSDGPHPAPSLSNETCQPTRLHHSRVVRCCKNPACQLKWTLRPADIYHLLPNEARQARRLPGLDLAGYHAAHVSHGQARSPARLFAPTLAVPPPLL